MKPRNLAVIDYGTGNLRSVVKAFEYLNAKVVLATAPDEMKGVDAVIFPGQGSFDQCMESLNKSGLSKSLKAWIEEDRPFFGICLGLQVLFESSEEGDLPGLELFKGKAVQFSVDSHLKIPHMGWNRVDWRLPNHYCIRKNLEDGDQFYFVHSYCYADATADCVVGRCEYGPPFAAALARKNVFKN